MPPKKGKIDKTKAQPNASKEEQQQTKPAELIEDDQEAQPEEKPAEPATASKEDVPSNDKRSKKRKNAADTDEPPKAARRSGRGAPKSQPSQHQLLNFMLSPAATELCRPDDETRDVESRAQIQTYSSSALNPFEELLCAIVLSRPISHRLGLRTIRTILNEPYDFTTPAAVRDAGTEKQHQALWDARTQHKDKTANQIGHVAEVVLDKFSSSDADTGLSKLRKDCSNNVEKMHDTLQESIKGLGKTGLEIFFRRVQWQWPEVYPFVDDRTRKSMAKLGLPDDAEALSEAIAEQWEELDTTAVEGKGDDEKKRVAFMMVLERAVGADLEGKIEEMTAAAASLR